MTKTLLAALALLLALPGLSRADTREEELFGAALQAQQQAEAAEAALLAPGRYGSGITALEQGRRGYRGGEELSVVEKLAEEARGHFVAAAGSAAQARLTFQQPLQRREAAREAEAFRLAGPAWVKAEELLGAAAQRLEKTDVKAALERAQRAAALYDEAQLQALKAALLTEARSSVVGLDTAGTARLAPRTTAKARELLQRAEQELDTDRARTGPASELAAQATAEAGHAMALSGFLREAREAQRTSEDLVLEWEAALSQAATAAGIELDLRDGPVAAAASLAAAVQSLRQRTVQQAEDLGQRGRQIAALEEEIRDLDNRLAGATTQTRTLSDRLAASERSSEQFQRLESLFLPDQAQVLRQGGNIIVRVQGLAFASGSSALSAKARPVLEKLREAVVIYPGASYAVEGHTDSSGDSGVNQRLSQARAESVREYLVNTLQVSAGRVTAIGYGDLRPVASNATAGGRRQNRRIDLVITPREGSGR